MVNVIEDDVRLLNAQCRRRIRLEEIAQSQEKNRHQVLENMLGRKRRPRSEHTKQSRNQEMSIGNSGRALSGVGCRKKVESPPGKVLDGSNSINVFR